MIQSGLIPTPDAIAFAIGIVVVILGFVISWRAYQGYRRNESRPMLLLAVGMLLITVIPTLAELIVIPWFVARYTTPGTGAISLTLTVSRLSEAVGISIVIYSLHSRRT
ncbi:DUF7521 family protein [Halobellus salinisoli]|uniref:DUF7521 family protein n=1 Tax=Halobellus salinisoli TaxID=3108500 RepID=UPI003CE5BFAD